MALVKPDPDDHGGRLNYACMLGHTAFVEQVVKELSLTNMDLPDRHGSHPLYNAAMKNDNPKLMEWLIDRGASVDRKTEEDGETAYFIAAYNNHTQCMKTLLKRGAKPGEPQGYYGDTVMHVAVRNNFPDVLTIALDAGANVNERNKMKETPLFLACKLGREPMVYSLLVRKANSRLGDRDGKDCLYIASEKKHQNIVAMLKAGGPAELLQEWHKVAKRHEIAKEREEEKKHQPSWDEIAFQRELKELGMTPDQYRRQQEAKAKSKPQVVVKEEPKKKVPREFDPKKPRPLFDSDEDSDEREERWEKERKDNERIAKELKRRHAGYRGDAGGTSFNTGAYMRPGGGGGGPAASAAQTAASLAAKRAPRDDSRDRWAADKENEKPADEKRSGSRSRAAEPSDSVQARSGSRSKQASGASLGRKPSGKRATRADMR